MAAGNSSQRHPFNVSGGSGSAEESIEGQASSRLSFAEGHPSSEIAEALTISLKTVERHRSNILAKLGMRDRTQLTRYAIRAGLVEP